MGVLSQSIAVEASGISECLDRLAAHKQRTRPVATYRLQFNRDFTFRQARELVPYLHALGISHCYASPILQARSPHGYDIVDHNTLNPELGGEQDFRAFTDELKAHGMGLVLDVVPNHMGVGIGTNPWWQDVLANGRSSAHARFFDIDWHPLRDDLQNKVLLPILGSQYGEVLERGEFKLGHEDGRFHLDYYDTRLPVDPQSVPLIFEPLRERATLPNGGDDPELKQLDAIVGAFGQLPPHHSDDPIIAAERRQAIPELEARLRQLTARSSRVRETIEHAIALLQGTPGEARTFDALHRLLEAQPYRPAHWRVSAEEINYRRFFDINDLVGLRMEEPRVFAATHRLLRRLLAEGSVTGLRIDHPDGLLNPAQYFMRLQMLYGASQCAGSEPAGVVAENGIERDIQEAFAAHPWVAQQPPLYIAVEKILEPNEALPHDWPVDGTVGYDFLNLLNGIFIDGRNQRVFTTLFRRFTGITLEVPDLVYESKKLILDVAMAGEVNVLTHLLAEISSTDRRARDFTRKALADAIIETIACFPVYRTYIDERGNIAERDRQSIQLSIARAQRRNEAMSAAVFRFLRDVLLLEPSPTSSFDARRRRLAFTLKFQQLTGPVMAKGMEDTACYIYNRLVSVNEVGGTPQSFGAEVDDFHRANMVRAERWPAAMLTTATHDTKRGEDVRARLNVLSEMPREWARQVTRWRRLNRTRKRTLVDGRSVPDHNEEYLLYQTLAGTWPFLDGATQGDRDAVRTRVQDYMTKAVHEAKVNLSWVNPNDDYVSALRDFIARICDPAPPGKGTPFVHEFEAFVRPVQWFGVVNSLAQALLKFTSPGAPDLYQGTEMWDFSLVDPDNRRPVDFAVRRSAAEDLAQRAATSELSALCAELLADSPSGRVKLWLTERVLSFRHEHADLFRAGNYTPLYGAVEKQEHLVAFARADGHKHVVVAVPRLSYTLLRGTLAWPLAGAWGNAELGLPPRAPAEFENVLTGEVVRATPARSLLCCEVFAHFPVALLAGR